MIKLQILETIIRNYLNKAMEKRWNPKQHGNRKTYSSLSQLVCVHEEILVRTRKYGRVDCIKMDFSKAGDKVVHAILVEKLRQLCIDPKVVDWIRAFLSNRVQSVKVNDAISTPKKVTSGLPQGSPLSNVLLNIYLNDLHKELDSDLVFQFCDDTLITINVGTFDDCVKLQRKLLALEKWTKEHHMKISTNKCCFISFSISNVEPKYSSSYPYKLFGTKIPRVTTMKYLGVHLSANFSKTAHIREIRSDEKMREIFSEMVILAPLSNSLKTIYYERNIRPGKMEKLTPVWSVPLNWKYRHQVEILESFQDEAIEGISQHNIEPLAERRVRFMLSLIFDILNRRKPYQKLTKALDIMDKDFSYGVYEAYYKSENSIIGAAINELGGLESFLEAHYEGRTTLQSLLHGSKDSNQPRNGIFNNVIVKNYSSFRFEAYKRMLERKGNDFSLVSFDDGLRLISYCFHPKLSNSKIETAIEKKKSKGSKVTQNFAGSCFGSSIAGDEDYRVI
jgi:hypothetical protein